MTHVDSFIDLFREVCTPPFSVTVTEEASLVELVDQKDDETNCVTAITGLVVRTDHGDYQHCTLIMTQRMDEFTNWIMLTKRGGVIGTGANYHTTIDHTQ